MGFFKKLFSSALTAAVAIGVTVATGGTATWALFGRQLATSFVLSYVGDALAPKPKGGELRDNTQSTRNPIASRKLVYGRSRVGGSIVYLESTGDDNKYLHMVVTLATHEIDAVEQVYLNDDLVWDAGTIETDWSGFVEINEHLGADDQAADSDLVAEVTQWTTSHRLRGVAYLYLKLTYDQGKFASGLPNVSAVIRGKKVYTGSTTEWSQNPAWCIRDYLVDEKYGMDIDASELDAASFAAAAAVCDEQVLTSEGYQELYTMDGVIDLAQSRNSIIESMLTSCGGVITYSGGKFIMTAGKYYEPTITIDESVIVGNISIDTKRSRRNLYNGVKGVFLSAGDNYVAADYPPVISSTYSIEDGDPLYLDLNLPFTTNAIRAQRLAKLVLLQGREQINVSIPCNLSALKLKAGDFVYITNERMGWSQKVFRITGYEIVVSSGNAVGVNLQASETSSTVYDWNTGEETPFVAGQATTLPNPSNVNAPTLDSVTAGSYIQDDGTARPYFDVVWTNNDAFTREYELQFRTGASSFESIITKNTNYRIYDVVDGSSYDIRVRAINTLGAASDFASDSSTAIGDPDAPSVPTDFAVGTNLTSFILQWTNPPEGDFHHVNIFRSTDSNVLNAVQIGTTTDDLYADHNFANGSTRYYWLSAVDRTGNESAKTSVQSATISYDTRSPRQAYGYVYYTVNSSSQPSTPSATSYNFNLGTISGLSTFWQVDPIVVDENDGTYWASRFVVQEDEFGGNQTFTFNTPFRSINFDGLVNFTNLNDELADANSSLITTINGGLINTGTVVADRIDVLEEANIGNLTVSRLKIKDQAVSDLAVSVGGIAVINPAGSYIDMHSLTIPVVQDIPIFISAYLNYTFYPLSGGLNLSTEQLEVKLRLNSTALWVNGQVRTGIKNFNSNNVKRDDGDISFIDVLTPTSTGTVTIKLQTLALTRNITTNNFVDADFYRYRSIFYIQSVVK